MRTTVDISDELAKRSKLLAASRGTTLRALIEEGLRHVLREHSVTSAAYVMPDASVGGDGLATGVEDLSWATMSHFLYPQR